MRRAVRFLSAILVLIMLFGSLPIITITAADDEIISPFDEGVIADSTSDIHSVNVLSQESIGNTMLYEATINSTGTRKDTLKDLGIGHEKRYWPDTFSGIQIAQGGKLFVYSKSSNGDFEVNSLPDIAKQFEADHPEWKVAIVANGTFFDNETSKTSDKGEPEDPYTEDGRIYKTYFEQGAYDSNGAFKTGRGLIGLSNTNTLDATNSVIYHTFENGTSNYSGSTALTLNNSSRYSSYYLEVLGENDNGVVYEYPMIENGILNYMAKPAFFHAGATKNLSGATVYKMKLENVREPHVTVNGVETGVTNKYYDGRIEAVVDGTSSMTVPSGYIYIAVEAALPYIFGMKTEKNEKGEDVVTFPGTKVRINKKMTDSAWANTEYVFGYKQQILHEGTALFYKVLQNNYGEGYKYVNTNDKTYTSAWTEDLAYGSYGSNRTALGFKADGTPVIIVAPRKIYYNADGSVLAEVSPTYYEMGSYMKSLGCTNAFMMDCGGSSQMYKKNDDGEYDLLYQDPISGERKVANALILAYPSGVDVDVDQRADIPKFAEDYISLKATAWKEASVNLRSAASTTEKSITSVENKTVKGTDVSITTNSNSRILTFEPVGTSPSNSKESIYAYTDLGLEVREDTKYIYCFKLRSYYHDGFTSFIFADENPGGANKKLNDFRAVNGTFSNRWQTIDGTTSQEGDKSSSVGIGRGRVQNNDKDPNEVDIIQGGLNLYVESSTGPYSLYRIDIDGLNFTLKVVDSTGTWLQIGETYTLKSGSRLIMGYGAAAYSTTFYKRKISVKDPIVVDLTDVKAESTKINALNKDQYTTESWEALQLAQTNANLIAGLPYQNIVDVAASNLAQAQTQIVTRESVLQDSISDYGDYDSKIYSPETWAKFQAAYEAAAQAIANKDYANMEKLNAAYIDARNGLVVQPVSIDLTWQEMDFVYTAGESTWDPETHTDTATGGSWQAKDNSNLISITNNTTSNLSVGLDFTLASEFSGVSGKFYDGSTQLASTFVIAAEDSKDIMLELEGAIPNTTTDRTKGGTVKITVSKISQ